jgi:membrane-associated phospholipid phosphatase
MFDPLLGVAIGLIGAVIAGPVVAYGLESLPERWRRTAAWALIVGAVTVAVGADLVADGPVDGAIVYVIAVLPGLIAYLAFRTLVLSALISLAPLYLVITSLTRGWPTYRPEVAVDRAVPLQPGWMLVYGSLYVFIGILPLMVVRQRELFRRAMQAYLTVMLVAYAGFLTYPTAAPRPDAVPGEGFGAWSLRLAYDIDPPHGCFPSLHVAYAFVSALAAYRVHAGVGTVAAVWAALIGVSTLFTKQHYLVDVIAGMAAALVAYAVFLRTYPRELVPERDRLRAPARALIVAALWAGAVGLFWLVYLLRSSQSGV